MERVASDAPLSVFVGGATLGWVGVPVLLVLVELVPDGVGMAPLDTAVFAVVPAVPVGRVTKVTLVTVPTTLVVALFPFERGGLPFSSQRTAPSWTGFVAIRAGSVLVKYAEPGWVPAASL